MPDYHPICTRLHAIRFELALVINSIVMAAAISVGGVFYIKNAEAEARRTAQKQLAGIANLKAREIVAWRNERTKDAEFFSHARFVANDVKRLLDNPESSLARVDVLQWLQLLKGGERYENVLLLNKAFTPVLSLPPEKNIITPSLSTLFAQATQTNGILMSDLHISADDKSIHFELLLPIFDPVHSPDAAPVPIGYILLQLNPREFLYPLIRSWPTVSATAETLLLRLEGDDVLYLNDLRGRPGTALSFRLPMSQPDLPSAAALRGFTGVIEGRDYRGVPVVAAGRRVAGTSWFMETKMDRSEIYAPLRQQAWMAGIIFGTLLITSGLLTALLWRHRAAADLKKANLELEKRVSERTADLNSKNRELESFTSSVSHDLKTPLRSIYGYSELLMNSWSEKLDEEAKKYLKNIHLSAVRMDQLIEDLLRYSRLEWEAVNLKEVSLPAVVNDLVNEHQEIIQREKVKVIVNISTAPLLTDVAGLSQALRNLIGNALKFSSKAPLPELEITGYDKGAVCLLQIRDNGIGFDMQDKEQIFEIFRRLPRAGDYPGTGVGLAIVKKSIQRLGGHVWAESQSGKGASFFIELPRQQVFPQKVSKAKNAQ